MSALLHGAANQPGWLWLALGALCLGAEVATGSGFLLWAAAAAGVVGAALLAGAPLPVSAALGLFALLTFLFTLAVRRVQRARPRPAAPPDLNDMAHRLVGRTGHALPGGRVMVDGQDWAADWAEGEPPSPGAAVRVLALAGGARLRVARAQPPT